MNRISLKIKATNRVKDIINCISQAKFDELASVTLIESSWCGDDGTQEQGIKEFGEWLTELLAMWAEDEDKEFVVDEFNKKSLDNLDIEDGLIWAEYSPTSHGEPLDFWFEIQMHINEEGKLISEFNVNI